MDFSFPERTCILCEKNAQVEQDFDTDALQVNCIRCRRYIILDPLFANHLWSYDSGKHLIAGVTRDAWERGEPTPMLSASNIDQFRTAAPRQSDVEEKCLRLLRSLTRKSSHLGAAVPIESERDYPLCYAPNSEEFEFCLFYLRKRDLIKDFSLTLHGVTPIVVTATGWDAATRIPNIESTKVFVAMWFAHETYLAYLRGIAPGVRSSGYKPIRIDRKEHTNSIDDEIIAEIRESRFIVADFTAHRAGVYFEAGFAKGFGLPVIWTCRNDHLAGLHFDTRQFNHISWSDPDDLREKLALRIRATIGQGPLPNDDH